MEGDGGRRRVDEDIRTLCEFRKLGKSNIVVVGKNEEKLNCEQKAERSLLFSADSPV